MDCIVSTSRPVLKTVRRVRPIYTRRSWFTNYLTVWMMVSHSDSVEYGGWFSYHQNIAFGLVISQGTLSVGHVTIPSGTLKAATYVLPYRVPVYSSAADRKTWNGAQFRRNEVRLPISFNSNKFSEYESAQTVSLLPIVLAYSLYFNPPTCL